MENKARIPMVQRVDYLKQLCCDREVLHLGCTDWPYTSQRLQAGTLLHVELLSLARELWGLDYDQAGLDVLAKCGAPNLCRADLEHLEGLNLEKRFDVILAGEMIEHLSNPGLFLHGVQRFMRPDSTLVITTINAYCGMRMGIYMLRGRGGWIEPVHPDHVAYYSYSTLRHLVSRANLGIKRTLFYDLGVEHRPHVRPYYRIFNDLCVRLAPQLADGIIVECRLMH